MRVVIVGVGAIGGTVGALLALAGQEVIGIARGRQLAAIRESGLILRSPQGVRTAELPVVATPDQIDWRADDAVLLCTKTQDTEAALAQLRLAGVDQQPIFCLQNGVENERLALRRFPNVHGVTVMLPAEFVVPGEIVAFGSPCEGIFDIGRFPAGADEADRALAEMLTPAGIAGFVSEDVMASKYGKLILNLANIVGAAMGREAEAGDIKALLRAEAEAVLTASGIGWQDVGDADPRRQELMKILKVEGAAGVGSSTAQSLVRGAGSIETDFLNGEIVLLGRLHGVPTPANAYFLRLAARMLAESRAPGSVPRAEVAAALGL